MDKDYLILKRASASRPSGEWHEDDYDMIADGAVVGRRSNFFIVYSLCLWCGLNYREKQ